MSRPSWDKYLKIKHILDLAVTGLLILVLVYLYSGASLLSRNIDNALALVFILFAATCLSKIEGNK